MPHSSFSSTQKTRKRGSSERPLGPRFDHDRAARASTREYDEYDSEDVFSSVRRRPKSAGAAQVFRSTAVDDEDPWVDTGSESGT